MQNQNIFALKILRFKMNTRNVIFFSTGSWFLSIQVYSLQSSEQLISTLAFSIISEYNISQSAGMVELVDSVDLGSTAKSVQVRVLLPAPIKKHPGGVFFYWYGQQRTRTHLNATLRWSVAIRRLDAGCSMIESSPVARTKAI